MRAAESHRRPTRLGSCEGPGAGGSGAAARSAMLPRFQCRERQGYRFFYGFSGLRVNFATFSFHKNERRPPSLAAARRHSDAAARATRAARETRRGQSHSRRPWPAVTRRGQPRSVSRPESLAAARRHGHSPRPAVHPSPRLVRPHWLVRPHQPRPASVAAAPLESLAAARHSQRAVRVVTRRGLPSFAGGVAATRLNCRGASHSPRPRRPA